MMERKLEVDVHAHWNYIPPVYRLYVNDEIFTERTFRWPSYQFYLTEHINCYLDNGVHTLTLEYLHADSKFELDGLKVDNVAVNKNLIRINNNKIEWKFIISVVTTDVQTSNMKLKLNDISRPKHLTVKPIQPIIPMQQKKYQTNLALVQRMRELNNRAAKK